MSVKAKSQPLMGLDPVAARHEADALYKAFKNGETIDLQTAASYCFYASSHVSDDQRTQYINRAIELDVAQQTQRQQSYDIIQSQKEAEQRERDKTAKLTLFRTCAEFIALDESIKVLNARVNNTNGSFMKGNKPSYLLNINKCLHTMKTGSLNAFEKALSTLLESIKDIAKRLDFVKPVYQAATALLENIVTPLPNQYKRGTVSPN